MKLDVLLIEEECILGEVKRVEQEIGIGMGIREIYFSKSLKMLVGEDVIVVMMVVGQDGGRIVMMLVSCVYLIYFSQLSIELYQKINFVIESVELVFELFFFSLIVEFI